jgi:hypothetical protein
MALINHDQAQIRDYLLGKLSEDEQQKIEQRLMVEDELFDEFEISKDELIEEYCAGELNRDDSQSFASNYLASQEGRERYAFALVMDCFQHLAPAPALTPPQREQSLTFLERIRSLFRAQPWAAAATSIALVVLVGILIMRMMSSRPEGQTVIGPSLAVTLITRGDGPLPPKVDLPRDAAKLKLQLLLPKLATGVIRYRAELDDKLNTKPVEVVDFNAEAVSVVIPARQLPPGEYSLQLFAVNADGTEKAIPGFYLFNIQ